MADDLKYGGRRIWVYAADRDYESAVIGILAVRRAEFTAALLNVAARLRDAPAAQLLGEGKWHETLGFRPT
jgi:hypothetical protein